MEILWKVFLGLLPDKGAIRVCRLVCRWFFESIESSQRIQLILKCDAWGYCQPSETSREPGSSFSISDYLRKLDAHVHAWRNLDWHELRIKIPAIGVHDLAHGVFAATSLDSDLPSIICITLPSKARDSPVKARTLEDIGFPVKDLAINPKDDLIVLLELLVVL